MPAPTGSHTAGKIDTSTAVIRPSRRQIVVAITCCGTKTPGPCALLRCGRRLRTLLFTVVSFLVEGLVTARSRWWLFGFEMVE